MSGATTRLIIPLCVAAVVVTNSCSDSAAGFAVEVVRRDSAGVAIVENGDLDCLPRWRLADSARWEIRPEPDGSTNPQLLDRGLRFPDGTVVVADYSMVPVRLYDSTGTLIRVLSRRGEGPGEIMMPTALRRLNADTFYVFDSHTRRTTFYGRDGYLGSISFRGTWLAGMLSATEGLELHTESPAKCPERFFLPITLRRHRGADHVDTLLTARGTEMYSKGGYCGPTSGDRTVIGLADDRLLMGESSEPGFGVYDHAGKLHMKVRWQARRPEMSQRDQDERWAYDSAQISVTTAPRFLKARLDEARTAQQSGDGAPSAIPYYQTLVPTDEGGTWVRTEWRYWARRQRQLIVDSLGVIRADILLPEMVKEVAQVTGNDVMVRGMDEDGFGFLRLYSLIRDQQVSASCPAD